MMPPATTGRHTKCKCPFSQWAKASHADYFLKCERLLAVLARLVVGVVAFSAPVGFAADCFLVAFEPFAARIFVEVSSAFDFALPFGLRLASVVALFIVTPLVVVCRAVAPLGPASFVLSAFLFVFFASLTGFAPSALTRRGRACFVDPAAEAVGGGPGRAKAMARTISPKRSSDGSQPSACAVSRKRSICSARLILVREPFATACPPAADVGFSRCTTRSSLYTGSRV